MQLCYRSLIVWADERWVSRVQLMATVVCTKFCMWEQEREKSQFLPLCKGCARTPDWDLAATCAALHSQCLCPFSPLALSLAVHLAYTSVESAMTLILSRTVFQLRREAHLSANTAHSFHRPGLSAFCLDTHCQVRLRRWRWDGVQT